MRLIGLPAGNFARPKPPFFRIFVSTTFCGNLAHLSMLLTTLFLFLGNPKTIILIIFILVIFFGAKRIPELFRGVGQGVREFKDASTPEPQQQHNPNYNQQPGYNQGTQGGYPQQQQQQQQPQQYTQNGYPQQPQPTAYNPNGNPQQYGQVPQAPQNPTNTPAS